MLIYKNFVLSEDEGSIDSISEGGFIVIIEDIYYLDHLYFTKLKDPNSIGAKIIVHLKINESTQTLVIPSNTKLSQLYKALIPHFGFGYKFLFLSKEINEKDDKMINNGSRIEFIKSGDLKSGH